MTLSKNKDIFQTIIDKNVVVAYSGPFDRQILSILATNIEETLLIPPVKNRRFFKIFIELGQNISYYSRDLAPSGDSDYGAGIFLIREFDNHFQIFAGNSINNVQDRELVEKCSKVEKMNRHELRGYKRMLRSTYKAEHDGGNIGIVQVALLSGFPIEFKTIPTDSERSFFIIKVHVKK